MFERSEDVDRIVVDVGADDGLGLTAQSGGYHVTVVGVGEPYGVLQVLPSVDAGVLEGVVHGGESPLDLLGWDLWVGLYDGVDRLGDDPGGPHSGR
jgi:hypothetical protein